GGPGRGALRRGRGSGPAPGGSGRGGRRGSRRGATRAATRSAPAPAGRGRPARSGTASARSPRERRDAATRGIAPGASSVAASRPPRPAVARACRRLPKHRRATGPTRRPQAGKDPYASGKSYRGAATLSVRADVAELVDAHGSGPCGRKPVEVQVLSSASLRRAGLFLG